MAKIIKMNEKTKETKPKYDPNRTYIWDEDIEITLSGLQYDKILKALQYQTNTPEYQAFLRLQEAAKVIQEIFIKGVEEGVIHEQQEEEKG